MLILRFFISNKKAVTMFNYQIERVKENILPFFWIGIIVGIVIEKAEYLSGIDWLNSYLNYANIKIDYQTIGQKIFFEHFAPNTLMFLLVAIFFLSAVHRVFWGALEKEPKERKGIIYALENFGSLLGIAWLGLMLGIMLPALIFEGYSSFFKFLIFSTYPIVFLFEVSICTVFLYWEGLHKIPEYFDGYSKWRLGTRLEGVGILCLAILFLTYHKQHESMMNKFSQWLLSFL
jgi:hypothetical protein